MSKKAKWNEPPCPLCREPVHVDAVRCPHCQADYSPQQVADRQQKLKQSSKNGAIGCGVLAVAIIALVAMCSGETRTPTTGSLAKDGQKFVSQITDAGRACDIATSAAMAASQGSDMAGTYAAWGKAESACLSANPDISVINLYDSFDETVSKDAAHAKETCGLAYTMKWTMAGQMQKLIDENASAKVQAEMRETAASGNALASGCKMALAGLGQLKD